MKKASTTANPDKSVFPMNVGYQELKPTLCIGLDFAWFGGSKNDKTSQYDFLAAALIGADSHVGRLSCVPVPLASEDQAHHRDPKAVQTAAAVQKLVHEFDTHFERIVVAVDAPLQTNKTLLERVPRPKKGTVERRGCEKSLSERRTRIDKVAGGACGWHPNVQPGAPLAPRLIHLLAAIQESSRLTPWTESNAQSDRLVIECFPAEAIWAAKRLNQFPEHLAARVVKAYKKQAGCRLSATQVRDLVETTLLEGFKESSGTPLLWSRLVEAVIAWMLQDTRWQEGAFFRGGKMLDDVVDSMLCLASAISYAHDAAHLWQDSHCRDDGHIIGPGRFDAASELKGSAARIPTLPAWRRSASSGRA